MPKTSSIAAAPQAYRASELITAGTTRRRLRAGDVRRAAHGIVLHPHCTLDLNDYRDRCLAIGQSLQQEFFLSHRSAALLYRIPAPWPPAQQVEVASFAPLRAPRRREVLGHRVRSGALEWGSAHGLILPSPADVWCQLSAVLNLQRLVAAGDFLVSGALILGSAGRREPPLAPIESLRAAHERHRGTKGSRLRELALPMLRASVDSPQESLLRLEIVRAHFDEPVVNCPIAVEGRTLHADLGYPSLKIAIDYEGAHHFDDPRQVRLDEERRKLLHAAGWVWIRVTAQTMRGLRGFFAELTAAIARADASK